MTRKLKMWLWRMHGSPHLIIIAASQKRAIELLDGRPKVGFVSYGAFKQWASEPGGPNWDHYLEREEGVYEVEE